MKSGNLNFLEPSGPLQSCNGIALLCINYIIIGITCMNNNNVIICNNFGRPQHLILIFRIPMSTRKNLLKICGHFEHAPSKRFASPGVVCQHCDWCTSCDRTQRSVKVRRVCSFLWSSQPERLRAVGLGCVLGTCWGTRIYRLFHFINKTVPFPVPCFKWTVSRLKHSGYFGLLCHLLEHIS